MAGELEGESMSKCLGCLADVGNGSCRICALESRTAFLEGAMSAFKLRVEESESRLERAETLIEVLKRALGWVESADKTVSLRNAALNKAPLHPYCSIDESEQKILEGGK